MFQLPKQVLTALDMLEGAGHEAFIVGGCVRDILLGKTASDYDITTSALPNRVLQVFRDFKCIEIGIKHGTVTVIIDGMNLEITTFRTETTYSDNRHPDEVIFTPNLEDDLSRRDFTVNAMAYNHSHGLVDAFGGKEDLKNQLIRCVGDPKTRFEEDALRIMRGLRFASVLGFEIEENTAKAMKESKDLLLNVSGERIAIELKKLLCGKQADKILVEFHTILEVVLPEIKGMSDFDQKSPYHIYDILNHTAMTLKNIPAEPHLRLAALLHDCGKADCFSVDEKGVGHFFGHCEIGSEKADVALSRLKFDNLTKNAVTRVIKYHGMQIENTKKSVKRALNKLTPPLFYDLLELQKADTLALSSDCFSRLDHLENLKAMAEKIINENECFSLKNLSLNGGDLIALGMKSGREMGNTLNLLLDAVIDGKVENEKSKLIEYLNTINKAH